MVRLVDSGVQLYERSGALPLALHASPGRFPATRALVLASGQGLASSPGCSLSAVPRSPGPL